MSPRPRKASDEVIFAAAYRIMSRLGPAQWTLADIAKDAGLTAGALVQRFGSKRGLMIALTAGVADATPQMFEQLRAGKRSPLGVLRAYADCFAQMGDSPGGLAHHLAYLQMDLTDPDLHRHVSNQARASRVELVKLVREAVAAGELVTTVEPNALARAIEVTVSGSLMAWAFYQEGPAVKWVRKDLEMVLRPYRSKRVRRKA